MRFLLLYSAVVAIQLGLAPTIAPAEHAKSVAEASAAAENRATQLREIQLKEVQRHTEILADDALEGRESGKQGGFAAANYIVTQLTGCGALAAGENNGYFQAFGKGYRNILAQIPDAQAANEASSLDNEWIILSAHYDHVGFGSKKVSNGPIGQIHNGADDNASGVAALLEVAESLTQLDRSSRRSILIVFWDAEEKGLLGSKHWLKHPTIDVDQVKLMINVDMIGRLRKSLSLFGTRTMPGLRLAWSRANAGTKLHLEFPWQVVNNSDHYEFFKRRVPITMVHTGLHDDYHRPSDDVHLLNQDGIQQTSKLLHELVVSLSNQDHLDDFRNASFLEGTTEQEYFERPFRHQQRRLGLTVKPEAVLEPDLGDRSEGGVEVETIWVGSPASQAGLRPGDRILEANGQPISSVSKLRRLIVSARNSILLRVKTGNGQLQNLDVPLAGKPKKIGFSWRTSDAEPGVMVLSGVVAGSPAEQAGCKALDRILKVNGNAIADTVAFRKQMANANENTELLIERNGRIQTVTINLVR